MQRKTQLQQLLLLQRTDSLFKTQQRTFWTSTLMVLLQHLPPLHHQMALLVSKGLLGRHRGWPVHLCLLGMVWLI